ncbi:MAG: hypothetical protein PHI73_01900 [Patescibacteria group bacterium]|nr:hypothetical protein [Patescibacteria group bacterium]
MVFGALEVCLSPASNAGDRTCELLKELAKDRQQSVEDFNGGDGKFRQKELQKNDGQYEQEEKPHGFAV